MVCRNLVAACSNTACLQDGTWKFICAFFQLYFIGPSCTAALSRRTFWLICIIGLLECYCMLLLNCAALLWVTAWSWSSLVSIISYEYPTLTIFVSFPSFWSKSHCGYVCEMQLSNRRCFFINVCIASVLKTVILLLLFIYCFGRSIFAGFSAG